MNNWVNGTKSELNKIAKELAAESLKKFELDVRENTTNNKDVDIFVNGKEKVYKIKVRSSREPKKMYCFIEKNRFDIEDENLLCMLVLFYDNCTREFLIPANDWKYENDLLKNREYEGLKSTPEWGINLSGKSWEILEKYSIEKMIDRLK